MNDLKIFYQNLPFHIDPVAFSLGPFSVNWYSLMYLAGALVVYRLLLYRLKKKEFSCSTAADFNTQKNLTADLLIWIFFGLLIGGRLGYVFFYDFSFYWNDPLAIISPFDPVTRNLTGIYGMSYHGGLLGALTASLYFLKKRKLDFFCWADFIIPAVPAGYFFGRIGNFLNGELFGRVTKKAWGMYFPGDSLGILRHASQLYEAALEGILLFAILWNVRNWNKLKGKMLGCYISGYAIIRIIVEFWREPDEQIGYILGILTQGQILSLIMLALGIALILYSKQIKKML